MYVEGNFTMTSGEALEANRRVKIKSGTTSTPPEVVYADAGEDYIGFTVANAALAELVAIRPINAAGIQEMVAAEAFALGAVLYGANDGKLQDTSSGSAQGIALEAATANGDHVQALIWSLKSTTAATVTALDTAGYFAGATVEAILAEIGAHITTAQASIPIPLGAITQEDGTALTKQATTVAGYSQLANKELVINIPINCTSGESLGFSVPLPQDCDITGDITVHVLAGKDADNDALTLDCEVYPVGAGDVANADIQDTAAQTIVAGVTELTFTCGADGLLANPSAITCVLALGGTNDGDAVYIYGAWVEYKRLLLIA